MQLRLLNERIMQVNVNIHLTHGISYIQVINLVLNMQITQINQENIYISTRMDQNALKA